MSKHLLTTLTALGLLLGPVLVLTAAEKAKAPADTPVETTKKPADTTKKKPAEAKPAEKKTAEPSDADKALMAHAQKLSANLTEAQSKKLLDLLNTGDDKAVQEIPGIGEVKSKAIKKARPYKSVADLIMVEGVGEITFDDIVKWAKEGMKAEAAGEKPAAKPADKPAAKPAEAPKKPAKETPPAKPAEKSAPTKKPA